MLRAIPNAANETEFAGGYTGLCGELITRGIAHLVTGTPLDAALLTQLAKTEIANGWASANGSEPIGSVAKGLALLLPKTIKVTDYGYSNPATFDWEGVLRQWGGIKPIGFEVRHAGVLPGDEKNVYFHFIAPVKWDPIAGYGYFIDGDYWGARQGILARYTLDDLRNAGIVGMVVVEWTAPASSSSGSGGNGGGQTVGIQIPAGWKDSNGVLTAPNGVTLDTGFRWMVVSHPGGWNPADVPLAPETHADHVLESDPKSPSGPVITFKLSGKYYWTDTAHKANDGDELVALERERAIAQQQATADAAIIAKQQTGLTASTAQVASLEQQVTALTAERDAAKASALTPEQQADLAAYTALKRDAQQFLTSLGDKFWVGVTPPSGPIYGRPFTSK